MATYMATSMTAASNAAAYYDGRSARTIVYASLSIAADGFRVPVAAWRGIRARREAVAPAR